MPIPIALAIHLDGDGAHPAAWRFASHSPRELLTAKRIVGTASLQLSKADQEKLFLIGQEIGRTTPNGKGWRDLPFGTDPAEQVMPRAGTSFRSAERR